MTRFVAFFLAFILGTAGAGAAERLVHSYGALKVSPDGVHLVAIDGDEDQDPTKPGHAHLVIRAMSGHGSRTIAMPCDPDPQCIPSSPTWSPDAGTIAFLLRDPRVKTRGLYVVDVDGSNLRQVLAFTGTLGAPRFSKDGHSIIVLATANAHKEIGATQAGDPLNGEIGTRSDVQRIAVVTLDGKLSMISPPDLFVYEYDEAPGGFVGTGAHGNGDNNWWIARLYYFDAKTGGARELYKAATAQQQIADPRVSPDGKLVAFIGGIMSDFGSTGGDVYAMRLDRPAGAPVDVTLYLPSSATSLQWNCSKDTLLFSDVHGDRSEIDSLSFPALDTKASSFPALLAAGLKFSILWSGSVSTSGLATSCTNASAVVTESFDRPPEIAVGTIGAWKDITKENAGLPAETHATSVTWKDDGFTVQGWLLAPLTVDPAKKYAMITSVHGGPSAVVRPRFVGRGTTREFLRRGYFVFYPNPRGSFGQGEAFTLANVKDFGYGDFRDIMSGINAAEKVAPIDDARLGITGGSYGGYMTMWAVTQTNRFKAGVSGAGLFNWQSYYGQNGIDEWMIPFFGASVYDDPAVYAKSSPSTFVKNVKTPTFAYVGERDVEVPAAQSLEFWHALATLGVPTSLVIYEGEGHRVRRPDHARDIEKRTLDWFDRYLK